MTRSYSEVDLSQDRGETLSSQKISHVGAPSFVGVGPYWTEMSRAGEYAE